MVKYLVERGLPVDAECRGGETAVTWGEFGNNGPIISYVKKMSSILPWIRQTIKKRSRKRSLK